MQRARILLSLTLAIGLPAAISFAHAAETKPKSPNAAAPAQHVLEKGMTAEAILQTFGKPNDIVPIKSGDIKAEKWTYRRLVSQKSIETASTQKTVSAYGGFGLGGGEKMVDVIEPDFRMTHIKVYQVTSLLMIDGKLTLGKQWLEKTEEYDG